MSQHAIQVHVLNYDLRIILSKEKDSSMHLDQKIALQMTCHHTILSIAFLMLNNGLQYESGQYIQLHAQEKFLTQ